MTSQTADIVLHHLVVKGRATADALAEAIGRDTAEVRTALTHLTSDGVVVEKSGRLGGFAPTAEGRARAQRRLSESELCRRRDELDAWYDDGFAPLNTEFKTLCAAWQMRNGPDGPTLNDHTDSEYDRSVLLRLRELHDRAHSHLRAVRHPRIDRYTARLDKALRSVEAGNVEKFTSPLQDSYHDIWMELHQDLLLSMQRKRTAADS